MVAFQPVSVRPFIERATENAGIEDGISLFDTAIHKLTGFPCRRAVPNTQRMFGCRRSLRKCARIPRPSNRTCKRSTTTSLPKTRGYSGSRARLAASTGTTISAKSRNLCWSGSTRTWAAQLYNQQGSSRRLCLRRFAASEEPRLNLGVRR